MRHKQNSGMSVIVGLCWCNLTVCMSELQVMLRRALAQLYSGPGWFWRHSVAAALQVAVTRSSVFIVSTKLQTSV